MKDRFDLEEDIISCWQIVSELKVLSEAILENPSMTTDNIVNILIGIEQLYDIKFNKAFSTFESVIHNEMTNKGKYEF